MTIEQIVTLFSHQALSHKSLPLRRRLASLQSGVLLGGCGLLLVLGVAVHLTLQDNYQRAVDRVFSETDRAVQKLAFRTGEVFDRVNQSTLLITHLADAGHLTPLRSLQQGGVLAGDVTRAVFLVDAKGFVVDSTSDQLPLNIADEDYFKSHKRAADLDVNIGATAPLALIDAWAIPVSRRMNARDGSFAGLVVASVDPQTLAADYAKSENADTVIAVLGTDGIYRSRSVGGKVSFGEKVDPTPLIKLANRTNVANAVRGPVTSPVDKVERFVTVAKVARYPLFAMVAVNADTALAGYRQDRNQLLVWSGALAALIVGGVLLLHAKLRELQASREQTARAEAAFRATLEGSMDAVSLMRAQRDAQGQLVDMTIVDCNARAAAMLGLTRDEMLGWTLCKLIPTIRPFLERFETAIRTRQASNTEAQARAPHMAGRWMHYQIVPFEDGVALITRDITERKLAETAMAGLARLDPLTQLGNRRDFEQRLQEAILRARRNKETLALLFLDLDGFKLVNDRHGHAAGDQLLIETARRLRECVRLTDTVNRLGGDEFTVTLEGAGHADNITELCLRIVESVSRPHALNGEQVVSTPSIGVAILDSGDTLDSLMHRADVAMYKAKQSGKACHRFATAAAVHEPHDTALSTTA